MLLARAVAGRPFFVGFGNLARVRFSLDRAAEAEATLDSGIEHLPDGRFGYEDLRILQAISAGQYERADTLADAFAAEFDSPVSERMDASHRFALAAVRGKLRDAERHTDGFDAAPGFLANPMVIANHRALLAATRGDARGAARLLMEAYDSARVAGPDDDLVYGIWLPTLIEVGGISDAERIYADWREGTPEEELGTAGRDARREIDAHLAHAQGRPDDAGRLWAAYERECPGACAIWASFGLARVHESAGDAGEAIAEYERFLTDRSWDRVVADQFRRGPVLERLGQLYDSEGDPAGAAKYYAMFVELWADADEELQPRVRAAQARLEEILRERG
jgi:tetratricopeptide (TPR) repeat protein